MERRGRPKKNSDDGCKLAPTCFSCPFPDCIEGSSRRYYENRQRHNKIEELLAQGKTRKQIAEETGVSTRAVSYIKSQKRRELK